MQRLAESTHSKPWLTMKLNSLIVALTASLLSLTQLQSINALPTSCPTLNYSPSILRSSPSTVTLRLSNLSPPNADTVVDWLDIHYQVNDGLQINQRLISPDPVVTNGLNNLNAFNSHTKQVDAPSIPIKDSDLITFSYTYHVKGTDFACTTPTFQAKASQVKGEQALGGEIANNDTLPSTEHSGTHRNTTTPTTSTTTTTAPPTTTVPLHSERSNVTNAHNMTSIPHRLTQPLLQQNPLLTVTSAVCPNLKYSVKLNRKQSDGATAVFGVIFVNEDRKQLDYVDLHYKVNNELYANFKLGSDVNQTEVIRNPSIGVQSGDRVRLFLTYKVVDVEYACDTNFVDLVPKASGQQMNIDATVTQKEQQVREASNRDANQETNK